MSFKNKVVLITGGSRGIGKQIALNFAQQGSNIAFSYLKDHKAARDTEQEILDCSRNNPEGCELCSG